jgi:hypothetical protein
MTFDRDIWTTANSLTKPHGDQAEVCAVAHHQAKIDRGNREGMALWKRIRRAVGELQAEEPGENEARH